MKMANIWTCWRTFNSSSWSGPREGISSKFTYSPRFILRTIALCLCRESLKSSPKLRSCTHARMNGGKRAEGSMENRLAQYVLFNSVKFSFGKHNSWTIAITYRKLREKKRRNFCKFRFVACPSLAFTYAVESAIFCRSCFCCCCCSCGCLIIKFITGCK